MMTQSYEAVFENGVFRPLNAPHAIPDGQRVRLIVEAEGPADVLALAVRVYEGLSESQVEEVEEIALDRREFLRLKDVDPLTDLGCSSSSRML